MLRATPSNCRTKNNKRCEYASQPHLLLHHAKHLQSGKNGSQGKETDGFRSLAASTTTSTPSAPSPSTCPLILYSPVLYRSPARLDPVATYPAKNRGGLKIFPVTIFGEHELLGKTVCGPDATSPRRAFSACPQFISCRCLIHIAAGFMPSPQSHHHREPSVVRLLSFPPRLNPPVTGLLWRQTPGRCSILRGGPKRCRTR